MIRDYQPTDFNACVELVNKVWDFDTKFKPDNLAKLFKKTYTEGSLGESNFYIVVEEKNQVKGFLFGKCGNKNLYKNKYGGVRGGVQTLFQLLNLKGLNLKKKIFYIKIMFAHQIARNKVEPSRENEVNLFAVDPDAQGKGYGKMLMNAYIEFCKQNIAKRVTLETDKECNMGFYDHFGFKVKGEFYSPMQKEYSGKSGDCYIYELLL
jgi:GNAT superfamily N-acetyltransferase